MKLLTHNMLSSIGVRGVKVGFPLLIEAREVRECEVDFNAEFVARVIPKLEWPELCNAAAKLNKSLPKSVPENFEEDTDFLRLAHHVLLEVEVIEGELVCPETGRKFPIAQGIPNMLLNEDEV